MDKNLPSNAFSAKIMNFRGLFVIALAIIFAIIFAYVSLYNYSFAIVLLVLEALLLCFLVFLSIYTGSEVYKAVVYIICILASVFSFVNFRTTVKNWIVLSVSEEYEIFGFIEKIDFNDEYIVISDIIVGGVEDSGDIEIYADFVDNEILYTARVGDLLSFSSTLYAKDLLDENGEFNAYYYRTNIKYRSNDGENFTLSKVVPSFINSLNSDIENNLYTAMGSDYGSIIYAMITGDKTLLDDSVTDYYSASGLGHILAISGLHIGILAMVLLKLFKTCRMKNSVANLLTVILLCFYALYTGFSPSVMRAVIMASILLLSKMLGRRYDLLNTVSGAVCLILITQPVYLFESGFILSVSAVYGIALFNKPILTALLSKKVPSFIAKTLAVSISVQIGIVPATIVIFKSIQVYTLLANLIILPIVSVIFILMLVGLFFVLLFDGFIFILMIASIPLAFVDMVSQLIAKLAFSSVYIVQTVPIAIFILCYFLYFLASRFVLQPKGKLKKGISIASLILCGVMLFSGVVSTLLIDNGNYVMAIDCYGGTTSVVCVDDKVYIVGDVSSYSALYSAIRKYNINSIDAILLTSLDDESATEIAMLNNRYNIGAIYSFINTDISGLKTLAQNGITVFKTYDAGETVVEEFSPIIVDYELLGYEFLTENGSIVFCSYNKKYTDLPFDVINRTIAIRCFMYLDCYSDRIFMTNASVNFNGADRSDVQYSNWDIGSYVFEYESGKTILLS